MPFQLRLLLPTLSPKASEPVGLRGLEPAEALLSIRPAFGLLASGLLSDIPFQLIQSSFFISELKAFLVVSFSFFQIYNSLILSDPLLAPVIRCK